MLAEIKSENNQLEEAKEDYAHVLKIYDEHLEANSRKIATVYYQVNQVHLKKSKMIINK